MRTARLPTARASVTMPPDVIISGVGWGPQVNKFEQATSDCHQMSLAGAGAVQTDRHKPLKT